jgi:hypothetical protein
MAGDKKSVQHLACTSPVLDCSLWELRNLFPTFDLKRLLLHTSYTGTSRTGCSARNPKTTQKPDSIACLTRLSESESVQCGSSEVSCRELLVSNH